MDEQYNKNVSDAICVFGTGRSGTTIFFRVFGAHPDLSWVSNIVEKAPSWPQLSVLSRLQSLALRFGPDSILGRRMPRPVESVHSLNLCTGGLFQEPRELKEDELTSELIESVREYHGSIVWYHGRPRLAIKHTGFPRFRFWRAAFPRARFIHILRDGRAVAHSLVRVHWWDGTLDSWWWGPMPQRYMAEYEDSGRQPVVLAAIVWKRLIDIYEEELVQQRDLPIMVVRYDKFTADPVCELGRVADFCDLPNSRRFREAIQKYSIRNADLGWRKDMDRKDLAQVERVLGEHLARYGFA